MTEVVIDNSQFYGEANVRNGRIVSIGGEQLAVEYAGGPLIVVPEPEMAGLRQELSITGWGSSLAAWMGLHLGMVVQSHAQDLDSRVHEAGVPA